MDALATKRESVPFLISDVTYSSTNPSVPGLGEGSERLLLSAFTFSIESIEHILKLLAIEYCDYI